MQRKFELVRWVCAAGLLLAGGWVLAADPPSAAVKSPAVTKPAADKPPADKPAASKPADDAAKSDADAEESKPPPSKTPGKAGSPQRFEPSEQVRPDFDVSFPIDI